MNRLPILVLCFLASLSPLFFTGCAFDGPQYPTTYGPTTTPTSTPLPATVNVISSSYNPGAVTIVHGGSVIWNNMDGYNHSVFPDNGAGSCATDIPLGAGLSITVTYPSPITINYHCSIHAASCNSTCASSCTGMVGTVVVQ